MRKIVLTFVALSALVFTSCSDDETTLLPVESEKVTNLHAPQTSDYTVNPPVVSGAFTKFSFKTGAIVTGDDWDIAFRGLRIIVNGGSKFNTSDNDEPSRTGNASLAVIKKTFSEVTLAPADTDFHKDNTGTYALAASGDSWYTYNRQTHLVTANAGVVLVVKTIDGNYAKMEILSYYKDLDSSNPSNARYYTFNYVYSPNTGDKNLQ